MRGVFGGIILGVCLATQADTLETKSALVFTGQASELRRFLDPNWISGLPAKQFTSAAVIDGKWEDLTFRYRLDHEQTSGGEGPFVFNNEQSGGHLLQLRKKFLLSDSWAFSLGKFNENFDNAHFAHILDFLKDNIVSNDIDDVAARARGFPIAKLSYSDEFLSADLIYSDDSSTDTTYRFNSQNPNFNRGIRQWLGVFRANFEEAEVTALVQKPSDMRFGFGGSLLMTPTAQMQLYGALFSQRGSRQPVLRNIYPDGATPLGDDDVYTTSNSYAASRLMEDRWYTRGMLGVGWTSETQMGLRFEWRHDASGMSPQDYRRWGQIIDFHRSLMFQDPMRAVLNIAWDAQALRSRQRDSFLIRIDHPLGNDFSVALNILTGVDHSVLWAPRLRFRPASGSSDAWIEFQETTGREGSEFGSALERRRVQVGFRYLFD